MLFSSQRHLRKSPSAGQEELQLTHRMASIRTPPRVDFNAYLNEQQDRQGFMGKMTSKLGGMFRGVKDALGSIGAVLATKEEPDTFKCSTSPSRVLVSSKDANFSSFRNHAINNVNFSELSNILKPSLANESFGGLNTSRPEIKENNISFGRANISNSHQEPLNQSLASQSNSNSINDSKVSQKSSSKGSKKIEVKRKKQAHYNTANVINYWTSIFEENCKKYALLNSQKRFSRNVKTLFVEGIKKPLAQRKPFNSVDFKKNPATGAMEIVRHNNKKRKNMEVEPLEDDSLAAIVLSKTSIIQVEKEKPIRPQLKKNKINSSSVRSSLGSSNDGLIHIKLTEKLKGGPEPTYRVQKRRTGAIFVDSLEQCQEEEVKPVVKAKSPIRNLIFEEDKQCNRSTDTDSGFGEVRNNAAMNTTVEKSVQTSAVKFPTFKMDTQCQTSPLRQKSPLRQRSLLLSAQRKSYEELKEETMFKKSGNNSNNSKVASPINVKKDTSSQIYAEKEEEEVIPVEGKDEVIPVATTVVEENVAEPNKIIPRTLNFDTSEENSRKDPINLSIKNFIKQQQTQAEGNVIEETKEENKTTSVAPTTGGNSLFQTLPKNLFTSSPPLQPLNLTTSNTNIIEGKKSVTIKKIEAVPKAEVTKPAVFEFLKQYEIKNTNKIHENNPFLNTSITSHQQLSPNDTLNTSIVNNNPFLAAGSQNQQTGILGILGRQSSDKKSNQSFELKPVTNNGLFGPLTNNNDNNQVTGINPNLSSNTSSLFNPVPPKQTSMFNGPLMGKKDEMDILDNNNNKMGGAINSLFNANPTPNPPAFLPQNSQNNSGNLFDFQNQQQQNRSSMSGMEVVGGGGSTSNSLFGPSNNLFGNSNNPSNNTTNNLFANTNNNNNSRPAVQLFSGNNNNNTMNTQPMNLFANTSGNNNNGGFIENQIGFGPSQNNNRMFPQEQGSQQQLNLFNNPIQNSNNIAPPNKLVFTSTSPFDNKPATGNNNNMNLFGNQQNNGFSNQNQNHSFPLNPPQLQHNMSFSQNTSMQFGNPNVAANFLNLGADNNNNGGGQGANNNGMGGGNTNNNNDGQSRVFRRIIQPQAKNRDRAF